MLRILAALRSGRGIWRGGLLLHEVERHAIVRLRIVVVAHPAPWRTVLRVALLLVALAVSS